MGSVQRGFRPKHQVLVLKCYPKFQKNNVEVKPNSSELSYLLYYASTRRSKLPKVGAFLESKAQRDVRAGRIGNVQITLQILEALIEKCPRDLSLYACSVTTVLLAVLGSNEITMVEQSVSTFEAFCRYQDLAALAADQEHTNQYETIVMSYAAYGSKTSNPRGQGSLSVPLTIRFRKAGLRALKCIASSESFASDSKSQMNVLIPCVLDNIYSSDAGFLERLQEREHEKEQAEKDWASRRRPSMATVRTTDEQEADPVAAAGTTAAADQLAEEEVGVLALQTLRQIFMVNNRTQVRMASTSVLNFLEGKLKSGDTMRHAHPETSSRLWPEALLHVISRWAPVQDRYVILVTVMEALVTSPIKEGDLEKQLVYANIVGSLLSSDINLIGLSVMDVLIGLVQHILLILQLGGKGSKLAPHHQQSDAFPLETSGSDSATSREKVVRAPENSMIASHTVVTDIVQSPSALRVELLDQLRSCVADLATHVYYSDQISDMLSAILKRLKPSPMSAIPTTASAIRDPDGAVHAISDSANLREESDSDDFFSFETARLIALRAVKDILTVANSRRAEHTSQVIGRNRVGVVTWEGTQWLLRDPSWSVRKAYVDALLTWLRLEVSKSDLRIADERIRPLKGKKENQGEGTTRRPISSASRRSDLTPNIRSTFLQLLHLAIYEQAHQNANSAHDLLLLHLVLYLLVQKLGINSVRSGLPMIMRLQEDIQSIESPAAKIRIGSLVHGYFWSLCDAFDLHATLVSAQIQAEISRRMRHGLWIDTIEVPPLPLERIGRSQVLNDELPQELVKSEALRPFDDRAALVEEIAHAYEDTFASPPASPPSSPSRTFSVPFVKLQPAPEPAVPNRTKRLPARVKEQMLSDWTRDICIAVVERDPSLSGFSRAGTANITGGNHRNLLALLANGAANDTPPDSRNHSPRSRSQEQNVGSKRIGSTSQGGFGLMGHRPKSPYNSNVSKNHRQLLSDSPTRGSNSSAMSTVHVDDLKRVLSGDLGAAPLLSRRGYYQEGDGENESMASADCIDKELDPPEGIDTTDFVPSESTDAARPSQALDAIPSNAPVPPTAPLSHTDDIPPVPSLPPQFRPATSTTPTSTPTHPADPPTPAATAAKQRVASDNLDAATETKPVGSARSSGVHATPYPGSMGRASARKVKDLDDFLSSIRVATEGTRRRSSIGGMIRRPPE